MTTTPESSPSIAPPAAVVPPSGTMKQPGRLDEALRVLFLADGNSRDRLHRILALGGQFMSAELIGYFQSNDNALLPLAVWGEWQAAENDPRARQIAEASLESLTTNRLVTRCISNKDELFVAAVPTTVDIRLPTVLTVVVNASHARMTELVRQVEQTGAALVRWRLTETIAQLDWDALACAGAAELVTRVCSSQSQTAAAYRLVHDLQVFFECHQVVLGIHRATRQAGCEVVAISGMADFEKNSAEILLLNAALDECLVRGQLTAWPPLNPLHRQATLAHRKLVGPGRDEAVLSFPLLTVDDRPIGALLITGRQITVHQSRVQSALKTLAPHLATALEVRRRAEPSWIAKLRNELSGMSRDRRRRRQLTIAALAALILIPWVPYPYRVASDCQVEPAIRRFCVAPYAGLLKSSQAHPGDVVTNGQALAIMDDRELRFQLSTALAELSRARTKRDQAMNEHDHSEARLAELEMERYELQVNLLRSREDELVIKSPLDGVVLEGDLDDVEGAPVKAGQALFVIAPLDPIRLELFIKEIDIGLIRKGQPVMARLEGGLEEMTGSITKLYPKSELHEDQNVFVAQVELGNTDGRLRPGMQGQARVAVGNRTLAWMWFHKPWHRFRMWAGW